MDIQKYYTDIRKKEQELMEECKGNEVFITSLFNREKNSTEGATCSASAYNAARAIIDGTHRLATPEEARAFLQLQERNRREAIEGEIRKRQQFVTVVNQREETTPLVSEPVAESPGEKKKGAR